MKEANWPDIYEGTTDGNPTYQMAAGMATIPEPLIDSAIEAAEECPGECIMIEVDE